MDDIYGNVITYFSPLFSNNSSLKNSQVIMALTVKMSSLKRDPVLFGSLFNF